MRGIYRFKRQLITHHKEGQKKGDIEKILEEENEEMDMLSGRT